jgi:hypothetical protein
MKIAFDVGGVLSKYPQVFRPLLYNLYLASTEGYSAEHVEVHIISDMHPKEKILEMLKMNDLGFIYYDQVHSADYATHGEKCKAILCEQLGIDLLIDDYPGYVADGKHVRLLVMPNTSESYYHDDWKTDGSEGDFGRRKKA